MKNTYWYLDLLLLSTAVGTLQYESTILDTQVLT
jgi:hypothetical protein